MPRDGSPVTVDCCHQRCCLPHFLDEETDLREVKRLARSFTRWPLTSTFFELPLCLRCVTGLGCRTHTPGRAALHAIHFSFNRCSLSAIESHLLLLRGEEDGRRGGGPWGSISPCGGMACSAKPRPHGVPDPPCRKPFTSGHSDLTPHPTPPAIAGFP